MFPSFFIQFDTFFLDVDESQLLRLVLFTVTSTVASLPIILHLRNAYIINTTSIVFIFLSIIILLLLFPLLLLSLLLSSFSYLIFSSFIIIAFAAHDLLEGFISTNVLDVEHVTLIGMELLAVDTLIGPLLHVLLLFHLNGDCLTHCLHI